MALALKTYPWQWNRIERPEINLHIYSQLTIDKGAKNTQWEKDLSLINDGRKTDNDMNEVGLPSYPTQKPINNGLKT